MSKLTLIQNNVGGYFYTPESEVEQALENGGKVIKEEAETKKKVLTSTKTAE